MRPDPEKHSGHWRLQLFVSSALIESGIPDTVAFPVMELLRYEYPDIKIFTGYINR
jgi:hypothetical protein